MQTFRLSVIFATVLALGACSRGKDEAVPTFHNVFAVNPVAEGAGSEVCLPAVVEEARTIALGFKTAGQIEHIYVKEGQRVAAGQVLAMLDTVDYALGISTLREKYRQMEIENQRRARLHASGNMSDNDYENAVSGMRQLKLQLQLEENKLAYCRLTSPAAGVVTKVNFEVSEMVDAGTPVIELMDNSRLEVVVDLPVRNYAERESFRTFSGESPLLPGREIPLTPLSLTPKADNTQLYTLRLSPSTPPRELTPGMNMTVRIGCDGKNEGIVEVPLSAVFSREGRTCVWVINPADSVIAAREVVTTGTGERGTAEITSGLSTDELIVRSGVNHLTEGEKVRIITESETNPGNVI